MKIADIKSDFKVRIQNGYVYEDMPYWDKVKRVGTHKKQYIGKLSDDDTFIPNKTYLARQKEADNGADSKELVKEKAMFAERKSAGGTFLLNKIAYELGIANDLKSTFGNNYADYLALAFYLVLEPDSPMYRFEHWAATHDVNSAHKLTSQRISEFMDKIPEKERMDFFRKQAERRGENEYLAYDTTSVSSYSEYIKSVKYGKNKEDDLLPQVNYALVFGEKSGLPVYYRKLPGNIADVTTVRKLLIDTKFIDLKNPKSVLDRGFFSAGNITALYKSHSKFILGAKWNTKLVQDKFEQAKKEIQKIENFDSKYSVQTATIKTKWNISNLLSRNIFIHYYYDEKTATEEKLRFKKMLYETKELAEQKTLLSDKQQKIALKYFSKKGAKFEFKQDAIDEHDADAGYFALISNDKLSSKEILAIYRRKDDVEKAFENSKERLEMRRTRVSSDSVLDGRFFVQFVALILLSHIRNIMSQKELYKKYTLQELLDSIDVIEKSTFAGTVNYSEATIKQRHIFKAFGYDFPT